MEITWKLGKTIQSITLCRKYGVSYRYLETQKKCIYLKKNLLNSITHFTSLFGRSMMGFTIQLQDRSIIQTLWYYSAYISIIVNNICTNCLQITFRWISLILSQEFPLPDVVRIWDSVLADEKRFDFLLYICCAMIL